MGEDFNDLYINNDESTFQPLDIGQVELMSRKLDEMRARQLLSLSRALEESRCSACGRKPSLFQSGGRDTIGCCEHIYNSIKAACRPVTGDSTAMEYFGIGIEVVE